MTAVRKFMFERDFDADAGDAVASKEDESAAQPEPEPEPEPAEPETPPRIYTEADLEAARAEAYHEGYDAGVSAGQEQGRAAAETEAEESAKAALTQVSDGLKQLLSGLDEAEARRERRALELAMTVARRLFPALERRHGLGEVETVVSQTLQRLRETPRVTVRAHPDTVATLESRAEGLAAEAGFDGKLKFIAEPDMAQSDVRVAWSDGSAERETERVWQEIDDAIRQAMDGHDEADIAAAQGRGRPGSPDGADGPSGTRADPPRTSPADRAGTTASTTERNDASGGATGTAGASAPEPETPSELGTDTSGSTTPAGSTV